MTDKHIQLNTKQFSQEKIFIEIDDKASKTQDVKNFVQDVFFDKGHWGLKLRQLGINFVFVIVLVLPVLILFNSLKNGKLWQSLYHWQYQDGFDLTKFLQASILIAIVVVLVCSLAFLARNNYREQKIYPNQMTYDVDKLQARKAVMDKLYRSRYGDKNFRESTKYYAVNEEQNIDDHLISDLFKESGVEIK
ncbi:hypothetical protein QMA56_01455 [Leuconostoc falkenbergense]|uniref:hypothetical protein n=1 Tax=Leuconostoc falkenbergense TaxID=2766470 RepID=UPI0024ACAD09|nr:hypothetical protein [Leuconostoc falkenbergense]MDI6666371.1 hypothetical protein [Leuconostoc falkenbergense]